MLDARGVRPRHRFGQNFLHDHNQIRRLIARSGVQRGDCVLEVGPGTGALTEALVEAGANIVACEIDRDMAEIVTERVVSRSQGLVSLVVGDCLDGKHELSKALMAEIERRFQGAPFRLIANLPYQAATPLMILLLTTRLDCIGQYVTIQREVGERLTASPRSGAFGPLSILSSLLARVEVFADLPPSCFWPAPEVTSVMIAIERLESPIAFDTLALSAFMQTLFTKRRKQLGSILGRNGAWPDGVTATMRPEELTPTQMIALMAARRTDH
ncbi:MAG: ribosomal RNA small subunit methyltransferase A [Phycisphaerales bacterium]|nr:ribosomal RNA small subunit methyltransferase A [Phycisphaerales bacterium]